MDNMDRGTRGYTRPVRKRASSAPQAKGGECGALWGDAQAKPAVVKGVGGGYSARGVRATYHHYSPAYETSSLACADRLWADPGHGKKLLKYPWTAFCLNDPQFSQRVCGTCMRVTNGATGASVIARAVDFGGCSGGAAGGLDLDPCAFNAIDTDGRGVRDGNLTVDVQQVECGADASF